jgi:hypothetical protein
MWIVALSAACSDPEEIQRIVRTHEPDLAVPTCFPLEVGPVFLDHDLQGDWALSACEEEPAFEEAYLFVREGSALVTDIDGLGALKDPLDEALSFIPGVWGHGIGQCCSDSQEHFCMGVYLAPGTTPIEEMPERLMNMLQPQDPCVGVVVGYSEAPFF